MTRLVYHLCIYSSTCIPSSLSPVLTPRPVLFQPWTVTDGPSTMIGTLTTAIETVSAVLDETCAITGRTAAYCNYTYTGTSASSITSTAYTTMITGESYVEYPVTVTAGAEKLVSTTKASSQIDMTSSATLPIVAPSTRSSGPILRHQGTGVFWAIVIVTAIFSM